MGRKKKPPKDDKEQSARFIETAGQIEADKETFEKACRAILKPKGKKRDLTKRLPPSG
ncbi:MAG: hypothetical protein ABSG42_00900 [Nitrospirota bacterium]